MESLVITRNILCLVYAYTTSLSIRCLQVAIGQVASTGMVALSYVQKVSKKVSLASDFMYNYMSKDVTASVGYDYILRQCHLRGKIDSNGCTIAFLEERLNMDLNFILSAEEKMSCFLEILKCILCCEDEDIGIIDNRTSSRDAFSRTWTYNTYHRSSSIGESYHSSQTWSYPRSSLSSSPGNEWLYNIHSPTTSTKPSQSSVKTSFMAQKPSPSPKGLTPPKPTTPSPKPSSSSFKPSPSLKPTLSELGKGKYKTLNPEDTLPIKPVLYPPSPLPSFKTSFTAQKPSPSPKGLTPPKSTTPSPKPSSSSSKPCPSLKPTVSEPGKGKYKTVDPKDTLPIYMIPKDIEDLIKREIVPEVLGLTPPKPTTPSPKPSSSSFKPSPSLKPTLSELGKGKYKTLNPEDTLPIKPVLYPPSPLPSFKTSFTAQKPSPSPKGLTPPKSTTPSPKPSSSSSKPCPSLKPTLSELGKGKYKTVDPKDTLLIYMIPKDIEDLIKRDIVPEVLKKPLSASTYQEFFAALLYAEDSYIEKWSSFALENVSMELHSATIYQKSGENKHSKASEKMDDKTFAVFKVDSLSKTRPFLLSRDFVFAKRAGKETKPFQHGAYELNLIPRFNVFGESLEDTGVIYRVVKSTSILVEFGEEFHSQHDSTCRYNISFSFNRVCLKRAHQAIAAASASLIGKFLFPNSFSQHPMHNSEYYNLYDRNLNLDEKSAVHRILNIQGPPPFLVKGPLCTTFNGNSESISKQLSRTGLVVKEAVLQTYRRHPQSKILVCAPINSTCDVLTRSLKIDIPASDIFRANAAFREIEGVPIDILPSCLYKRDAECFSCPSLHELREFRVIFSTFTSSYRLYNAGISAGHFSHIFLVDASSATEPETLVALANFADDSTTVIVTGAPGNRSSTVRSDIARQKGLRISYFERLYKLSPFKNDDPMFVAQLKDRLL
ncbi:hypothetical protein Goshw_002035 [Gossypium schwendimanii]|uniref:RNA helicase SDE3 n=1 Tax=Gossypium schwendimanii TaxID=34291 RepID=A0A7J9KPU8_GOSSC|nr:hypothetical protein [Gossypium schwendimanii]